MDCVIAEFYRENEIVFIICSHKFFLRNQTDESFFRNSYESTRNFQTYGEEPKQSPSHYIKTKPAKGKCHASVKNKCIKTKFCFTFANKFYNFIQIKLLFTLFKLIFFEAEVKNRNKPTLIISQDIKRMIFDSDNYDQSAKEITGEPVTRCQPTEHK